LLLFRGNHVLTEVEKLFEVCEFLQNDQRKEKVLHRRRESVHFACAGVEKVATVVEAF
jgi:hypothetical protein